MPVNDFSCLRKTIHRFFLFLRKWTQLLRKRFAGDLNPLTTKFFIRFLYTLHRTPVNDFSNSRDHSQAFFYFPYNSKIPEEILFTYKVKSQSSKSGWLF